MRSRNSIRLFLATALLTGAAAPCAAPAAAQDTVDVRPGPHPVRDWGGVRYFAEALVTDTWAVATAPFGWDRDEWLMAGGVMGVGLLILPFDEQLLEAAQRNRDAPVLRTAEDVAKAVESLSLMGRTNKYYASGVAIGTAIDFLTGYPRVRWIFEELLIGNWVAGFTRKGIGRAIVGRSRPVAGKGAYHRNFWDGDSFPSGHASNFAQFAAVVSHHVDWWPVTVLLYSTTGAVMYERIADAGHWPSDSWVGAFWGWGVSQVVIRRREQNRRDFEPIFDAGTGAVGFRVPAGPNPLPGKGGDAVPAPPAPPATENTENGRARRAGTGTGTGMGSGRSIWPEGGG